MGAEWIWGLGAVSISSGCRNKVPQTAWLPVCSFMVLNAQNPNRGIGGAMRPPECLKNISPCCFWLCQHQAVLGCGCVVPASASVSLSSHQGIFLSLDCGPSQFSVSHLNLIMSAKILFPNKVLFTGKGVGLGHNFLGGLSLTHNSAFTQLLNCKVLSG